MQPTDIAVIVDDVAGQWRPTTDDRPTPFATGVSVDTRTLVPGDVFVPLPGKHTDGHAHCVEAVARGAVASFWKASLGTPPSDAGPVVVVADPLEALHRWAQAQRRRESFRCVAITGSVGKTTTKQMVAAVLATRFRVHATHENQNNEIGVPLTLLNAPPQTEWVVVEMGMRGLGQIAQLSVIAQPDVAMITYIGEAHIEQLQTRERIAQAKAEIVTALQPGGAIFYANHPLLLPHVATWHDRYATHPVGVGEALSLATVAVESNATSFQLCGTDRVWRTMWLGAHHAHNALFAIGVGRWAGIVDETIAQGLASTAPTAMRMEPIVTDAGVHIWNDTYNASPSSMCAGLATLAAYPLASRGRKIAVLGEMRELGAYAQEGYVAVATTLHAGGIDWVVTLGAQTAPLVAEARRMLGESRVHFFEEADSLVQWLKPRLRAGDIVFCKGSRALHMEQIVSKLQ